MHDKDDGPSDPAKVRATITSALAAGLIKLPGAEMASVTSGESTRVMLETGPVFTATATTSADGTATFPLPGPKDAESAGTAPGEVMCHCSEDDGVPDVGVSVGLGNDRALWIGDLLERDGATCGFVFHGHDEKGDRTRIVAPFADGTDWQEVADLFRHHVGPAIEQLVDQPVTHATRPEVEILLAGRLDLMRDIERRTKALGNLFDEWAGPDGSLDVPVAGASVEATIQLLDRLGAYIVGQDTRLIAAGEALTEAKSELAAAVIDRDKADAAHGCAVRDYRAQLAEEVDAHRRTVASLDWVQAAFERKEIGITLWGMPRGEAARQWVEGLKNDVRSAEKGFEEEREKRKRAERLLGEQTVRTTELEMRIEGAIFALRHGMNEGIETPDAMFSPSTSLVDYLAAPLDGKKPKIPGRGLYGDETIVVGVDDLRESIRLLGRLSNDDLDDKLSAVVERLFLSAGLLPERHYKPRFRVVTSPRLYSGEDEQRAVEAIWEHCRPQGMTVRAYLAEKVDLVATALGMRRAEA